MHWIVFLFLAVLVLFVPGAMYLFQEEIITAHQRNMALYGFASVIATFLWLGILSRCWPRG